MAFRIKSPVTFREALEGAAEYMDAMQLWFGHGTDNSWDEAVALLLWSAALPVDTDEVILGTTLEPEVTERFILAINRRVDERIPTPYITSEAWFCGLPFHINKNVLVPRSPIAELINNSFKPWAKTEPRRILDLCCGSGCIGIASALLNPESTVVLSDLSSAAIQVAKKNIDKHDCADRVTVLSGDLFEPIDKHSDGQFDLILCNPPYVDARDLAEMPPEYHHEPSMGLGSGEDGLDLTRQILSQASDYLSENGLLVLEVGNSWVHLEEAYPQHAFMWIEFVMGGQGVCVLDKGDLEKLN